MKETFAGDGKSAAENLGSHKPQADILDTCLLSLTMLLQLFNIDLGTEELRQSMERINLTPNTPL
jgi:hypothetical protein